MMHFLAMGGYGAFVWPAYGISFGAILIAVVLTFRAYGRAKNLLEKIEKDERR